MAESLGIAEPVLVARLVEELEELVSSGGVSIEGLQVFGPVGISLER